MKIPIKKQKDLRFAPIIFDMFGVLFQKEYSSDGQVVIIPIQEGTQLLHELATRVDESNNRMNYCYLLSNASNNTIAVIRNQYPEIFALFDGIVTSQDAGYSKPDTQIYKYLINKFKLNDQPGIFIDDTLENIIAAERCGLVGVQWMSGKSVRALLKQLKVL